MPRALGVSFVSTEAPIAQLLVTKRGENGPKCTGSDRAAPKVRLMDNLGSISLCRKQHFHFVHDGVHAFIQRLKRLGCGHVHARVFQQLVRRHRAASP